MSSWYVEGDIYVQGPKQATVKRLVRVPDAVPRDFKGKHATYLGARGQLVGNRMHVTHDLSYCRDQEIPALGNAFRNFYENKAGYKLLAYASPENTLLDWKIVTDGGKDEERTLWLKSIFLAAAGETNKRFSIFASPYLIRWLVSLRRVDIIGKDWNTIRGIVEAQDVEEARKIHPRFTSWMGGLLKRADRDGIMLNTNFKEAWGNFTPAVGNAIPYGYMGLVALEYYYNKAILTGDKNGGTAMEVAFPPITAKKR